MASIGPCSRCGKGQFLLVGEASASNYRCDACGFEVHHVQFTDIGHGIDKTFLEKRRDFMKKNKKLGLFVLFTTILAPVLGYELEPTRGLIIGLAIGLLNYVLTPYVAQRRLEILRESYS